MVAARNHLLDVRRQMNATLDAVDALKTCLQARQARQMLRARAMDEAEAAVLDYDAGSGAGRKHKSVLMWDSVAAVLAPSGLRQQALDDALAAMGAELVQMAAGQAGSTSQSHRTAISALEALRTGRSQPAEQFRVRVVLQVWQRRQERAPMIVVDAGHSGPCRRVGLMRALSDVCALITMTARARCPKAARWHGRLLAQRALQLQISPKCRCIIAVRHTPPSSLCIGGQYRARRHHLRRACLAPVKMINEANRKDRSQSVSPHLDASDSPRRRLVPAEPESG